MELRAPPAVVCATCAKLDFKKMAQVIKPLEKPEYGSINWTYDTRLQVHHSSFRSLVESAATCPLCLLIMETFVLSNQRDPETVHALERAKDDECESLRGSPLKYLLGYGDWQNLYADIWPIPVPKSLLYRRHPPQIKSLLGSFVLQGRVLTDQEQSLGLFGFTVGRITPLDQGLFVGASGGTGSSGGHWVSLSSDLGTQSWIAGRQVESRPDLDLCPSWMAICASQHPACGDMTDQELPTRVIDIGEDELQEPRLMESHGRHGKWAALSYCWGGAPPLTTKETYIANLRALNDLPPLFRDAIIIARGLGLRYLWIDTLCIIQGDEKDWERECTRMADVYAKAAVTISGPAATSPEDSLLHTRPTGTTCRFQHKNHVLTANLSPIEPSSYSSIPKQEPSTLSQRAWVFQERLLSPRTIYFGTQQVYWECRTAEFFESCLHPMPLVGATIAHSPVSKDVFREDQLASVNRADLRQLWRKMVERFSVCDLSYQGDRLPALSALASRMADRLQDTYLAGIWTGDLQRDLAWYRNSNKDENDARLSGRTVDQLDGADTTNRTYIAPSWSWAARAIPILFHEKSDHCEFEVVDTSVVAAGLDPYGRVTTGNLSLLVHLKHLDLLPATHVLGLENAHSRAPDDFADYWPDSRSKQHGIITAPCILLAGAPRGIGTSFHGLALEKLPGPEGFYRRIGYIENSSYYPLSTLTTKRNERKLLKWRSIEKQLITIL
ncbi:hypothetical protein Q7P37_011006 [Cladosporium fusiforme]